MGLNDVEGDSLSAVLITRLTIKAVLTDGKTIQFCYPSEEALSAALREWAIRHPSVKDLVASQSRL